MKGFTLLEIIVVIAIMGIFMISGYPSIMNSMENRQLDNLAREVSGALETARFKAIDTKVNHRVRFVQEASGWTARIERETSSGVWTGAPGQLPRVLPAKYVVTLNLPDDNSVEFSSVGLVEGYDSTRNSLTIQSLSLKAKGRDDIRQLQVFAGGSIRYLKMSS